MIYTGSCYCREIKYEVNLSSPDEARTSLCHCKSCKVKFLRAKNGNLPIDVFFEQKFFGTAFGLTAKIPRSSFKITSGKPKVHESDNGSRSLLHREFCPTCGSGILEYCEGGKDFVYIMYGTLDNPSELPPKGEFFCKYREEWMPEIPNIFHKQEIKS